jgi:Ca2+-binding RTX toxin-like protein
VGDVVDEQVHGGSSGSSQVGSAFYRDARSTSDTIVTSLASYDLSNTWSHNSPFFGGPSTRPPQAISGTVENLTMTGLSGINTGIGNDADNVIRGSLGVLYEPRYDFSGLGGKDTLIGGYGADHLDGGADADTMRGGDGNDTYVVDNAGDVVSEDYRGGSDTVQASISHTLHPNVEDLVLTGTAAINGTGNRRPNELTGNTNDNILDGGLGADTMAGGLGNDTFRFTTALSPSNVDKIVDFNVAQDTIQLDNAIFTGLAAGTLAAGAFRVGAAAADADDRIIYNNATGTLAYDADGNAAGGATVFATIVPWTALTSSEFLVI